jgi:hypothetical protein
MIDHGATRAACGVSRTGRWRRTVRQSFSLSVRMGAGRTIADPPVKAARRAQT